jgi:hypothetical protein
MKPTAVLINLARGALVGIRLYWTIIARRDHPYLPPNDPRP